MKTVASWLLATAFTTAAWATPPVDHFTRHADYEQAHISPTGEYLAVTNRRDEYEHLTIIDLSTNTVRYRTHFGEGWDVANFHWATPERILVQPARRVMGRTDYTFATGEIYGLNADGSDAGVLFGIYKGRSRLAARAGRVQAKREVAQILHLLPDEPKHILIGTRSVGVGRDPGRAYRMDIHTGRLNMVARGRYPSSYFVPDNAGTVRFEVGETDKNVTEVYHVPATSSPDASALRAGSVTDAVLVSTGTVNEGAIIPTTEIGDGWYYARDNTETATARLVRWHPASGRKETVFHEPTVDIGEQLLDAERNLIGVRFSKHYPDYHYVLPDDPLARMHRHLRNAFPDADLQFTSLTDDGRQGVVLVFGDRQPSTFYLVDFETSKMRELIQTRPWLSAEDLSPMTPVEVSTRDGTAVHGYLTTPAGAGDADPLPLVVLVHGGPHFVRDYWGFDVEAQLFASRGFAVLQMNYRGSGGYGKDFLHSGYGRWGREMQDDITDATRWAVTAGIADPERICIYGASYGGYAALTGAFREPDLYQCAVGYVGVYDLPMMFKRGDIPGRRSGVNYLKEAVGEDKAELRARSPVHNAESIKAAVMLVHGALDVRVPIGHAERMRRALKSAGNPVEVWHVEKREGHGFGNAENREKMYTKMLAFFERHIGRGADSGSGEVAEG